MKDDEYVQKLEAERLNNGHVLPALNLAVSQYIQAKTERQSKLSCYPSCKQTTTSTKPQQQTKRKFQTTLCPSVQNLIDV